MHDPGAQHGGPDQPVLLRVAQVCRRTGLSPAAVHRLIASGDLASIKIGAARRVPVADLEEFVQRLRMNADQGR